MKAPKLEKVRFNNAKDRKKYNLCILTIVICVIVAVAFALFEIFTESVFNPTMLKIAFGALCVMEAAAVIPCCITIVKLTNRAIKDGGVENKEPDEVKEEAKEAKEAKGKKEAKSEDTKKATEVKTNDEE